MVDKLGNTGTPESRTAGTLTAGTVDTHDDVSSERRAAGAALAATVVGLVVGAAAVLGASQLVVQRSLPQDTAATSADAALLGGAEYGSRS